MSGRLQGKTALVTAAGQGIGRPGTCTGKWRLNVTGEFSPMYVQNFLKNRLGSGEVNTNVNDNN